MPSRAGTCKQLYARLLHLRTLPGQPAYCSVAVGALDIDPRYCGLSLQLQAQADQCLNDNELQLLSSLLQEHASVLTLPAADGAESEELRINYDGFNSV